MKKQIRLILTGIAATAVGSGLMIFPFRIFDFLTPLQMKLIFAAELIIYFTIFAFFAMKNEARANSKIKNEKLNKRHCERIEQRDKELQGIKIPNYDFVA